MNFFFAAHNILVHRFSIAAVNPMCAWHVPAHAEALCRFKLYAHINVAIKFDRNQLMMLLTILPIINCCDVYLN